MSIKINSELKKKIFITILILLGIRIGSQIPTYGVDTSYFELLFQSNGSLAFLNSLTGNSLKQLSVFALSITPYITASIIVQLLTVAIPKLEDISKDGPEGKKKIENITYIVAGVMGYLEALLIAIGYGKQGLLISYTWYNCLIITFIWGTFALVSILLGKLIDKKGIGNGISLILLSNILSSIPSDFNVLYQSFIKDRAVANMILNGIIIVVVFLAVILFAMVLNNAEKRIPIQYSGKISGGKSTAGGKNVMPIKVCIMGVMPIIFASSIMSFPSIIATLVQFDYSGTAGTILKMFNSSNWFDFSNIQYSVGYLVYALLVIFFGYFYTSISFNTIEIAENLKRNGGTILGIRPGKPTIEYLNKQMKYLIFIGTCGLLIIATFPMVLSGVFNISNLSFGGTTIMIVISVIFETKKQFETENASHVTAQRIKKLF